MLDTIELLESLGGNAMLRHASMEELAPVLEQTEASEAFKAAIASGDSSSLFNELRQKPLHVTYHSLAPAHEEDEPVQNEEDTGLPSKQDDGEQPRS